jgi:enoyl-CoA hydratase/carnithine racemase
VTAAAEGMVRVEDLPSGVRVVTLVRPASRNALTPTMLSALEASLREFQGLRALVL